MGFLGDAVVKNPPASVGNTRNTGLIPEWRRSLGVGNGSPLHYSCLEKFHTQRSLVVPGVAESQTHLSAHTHTHTYFLKNYVVIYFLQNL